MSACLCRMTVYWSGWLLFLSRLMRDELRDDSHIFACLASAALVFDVVTEDAVLVDTVLVFLQGFLHFGDTLSTMAMMEYNFNDLL